MEHQLSLVGERPGSSVLDRFQAIGLIRGEFFQRAVLESISSTAVQRSVHDYLVWVASAMGSRPVWYRTADLWSDEGNCLEGSQKLEREKNPVIGQRGIRRSLALPDEFATECAVLAEVQAIHPNVRVQFPFISTIDEFELASERAVQEGVQGPFGTMIETPAAALAVDALLDAGASRLMVGLNDLSCLTLASERGSSFAGKLSRPLWDLIERVRSSARSRGCPIGVAGSMDREVVSRALGADLDFASIHYSQARTVLDLDEPAWPDEQLELDVKIRTRDAIVAGNRAGV
jgi:phosphoenolpyruvate-protein kinase (PTS system EI component)